MNNSLDETREIKLLISQVRTLRETIQATLYNSSMSERNRYVSFKSFAETYNALEEEAKRVLRVPTVLCTFDINNMGSQMDTFGSTQKQIMEEVYLHSGLLLSALEGSLDFVSDETENLSDFFQSRLRSVIFQKPDREVEVQNAIESLLLGRGFQKGSDYDRESGKFEFSGKEYIPDFIIPKLKLCIEVKLLKEGRRSKMVEEISADITAYKSIMNKYSLLYMILV